MKYTKIELIMENKEAFKLLCILRRGQKEEDVELVTRIVHLIDEAQRKSEYEEERK